MPVANLGYCGMGRRAECGLRGPSTRLKSAGVTQFLPPPCPRLAWPQVRTTRNFFIDLILICILLAIGLYLYDTLK